jgi:hypothetical protein
LEETNEEIRKNKRRQEQITKKELNKGKRTNTEQSK